MRIILPGLCLLALLMFSANRIHAADTNGFQVTIELQDGSKLVGKAGDDSYRFHSEILGDLNLPLAKIRSIECQSKTNSVKLVTPDGDTLQAHFLMPEIRVTTTYGKVKLPANLLKKIQVVAAGQATPMLPGLVALWSAEGNGNDAIGGNHATLTDVSFAPGEVGQAFNFNSINASIKVAASSSLNVGVGSGFTLAAWINPTDVNGAGQPIIEWNDDGNNYGVHSYVFSPGKLYVNVMGNDGSPHMFFSPPNVIVPNVFQHVALVYDKTSGLAKIYRNGVMVAQQDFGSFTPQTTYNLYLGKRPLTHGENLTFVGLLDNAAIYNRALSAEEVKAISVN